MENIEYLINHFSIKEFLNTWSVARAAGITAFIGFGLSTISGMLSHWKSISPGARSMWQIFHQWIGWNAWLLLLIHIISILFDTYVDYSIAEVLVPFLSDEETVANALGIISGYLFLAIILTSDFIRQTFPKVWRAIHQSAFPAFVLMLGHAIWIGTDRDRPSIIILYGVITFLFVGLAWMRSRPNAVTRPNASIDSRNSTSN